MDVAAYMWNELYCWRPRKRTARGVCDVMPMCLAFFVIIQCPVLVVWHPVDRYLSDFQSP